MEQESSRKFRQEFDEGMLSEDEIRVVRRLLPSKFLMNIRSMKRKDFFKQVFSWIKSSKVKNSTISVGSLKQALYNIGLSKREDCKKEELKKEASQKENMPLSIRS